MTRVSILLTAAGLLACAHASRSADPAFWHEVRSEHFLLRTDIDPEDARRAAQDLELVRAAILASGWHDGVTLPGRVSVVELASAGELREFVDKSIAGFATSDAFRDPMMIVSADRDIAEQPPVKHELTHVANGPLLVSRPRWVDEGLACYLDTARIDRGGGRMVLGKPDPMRLLYLERNPVRDYFGTVINVGRQIEVLSGERGYAFEAAAWLLVHWMIDTRPADFRTYLKHLAQGENSWIAFNSAFPGLGEAQIRDGVREWLRTGMKTVTVPLPAVESAVSIARMQPAEVFALRAQLAKSSSFGRTAAERKRLVSAEVARALAADPAHPLALLLSEGGDPAAAVAAHPEDWRAWVLLYDRRKGDPAAIEKAVALEPENATVLVRLAYSEQNAGRARQALAHATHAAKIAPGRPDVLDALAQIYAANHHCRAAADAEQRAIDAVPDSANTGVPRQLSRRLSEIENNCVENTKGESGR